MTCLEHARAAALARGALAPDDADATREHLQACSSCQASARLEVDTEAGPDLEAGRKVGRYLVLRKLGAGDLGAVYAAFDPELERKVSLRVLRRERAVAPAEVRTQGPCGSGSEQSTPSSRLLRESQALARLAHPNVVAVHDVGTVEGYVFLAMELVEGETLARWLRGPGRRPREVLEAFLAAGAGLAAAHASGLVHGGFTSESVLVGRDGRVRVTDFGLARSGEPGPRVSDVRSDQFNFCVALNQALLPFRSGLSGAVRAAVLQGLSPRPEARHRSMEALLLVLSRRPSVTAARVGIGAALLALVTVSGGLWWESRPALRCESVGRELSGVWDEGIRGRLQRAFLATGLDYARDTFDRTAAAVDAYAEAWARRRRSLCLETSAAAPSPLAVRESVCLARRLGQLRALTMLLSKGPDPELLRKSIQAARGLESLEACGDARSLLKGMAPPEDPALRAKVAQLEGQAAAVGALDATGKYLEGRAQAEALLAEAEALGWPPLRARALLTAARLLDRTGQYRGAEQHLRALLPLAARVGDDTLGADAWSLWLVVVGQRQARLQEALSLRLALEQSVERTRDVQARARSTLAIGTVLKRAGRVDEARQLAESALASLERTLGADDLSLAAPFNNLAIALNEAGRNVEALGWHRRALALRERALGPQHPDVAMSANNLGNVLRDLGQLTEAKASYERAVRIGMAALGAENPIVLSFLGNMGTLLMDLGLVEEGMVLHRRILALREEKLGGGHIELVESLLNLGIGARELGHLEESRVHPERALAISERTPGMDAMLTSVGWVLLALTETRLAHYGRAQALLERSQATRVRALGKDSLAVAECVAALADLQRRMGRLRAALDSFERAMPGLVGMDRAWYQFQEARLLWQLGEERPRALTLARVARDVFERAGQKPRAAEISAWLAAPRP